MKNQYEIRGDVTAIFITSKKYGDREVLVSTSHLEKVDKITGHWCLKVSRKGSFYIQTDGRNCSDSVTKKIMLHRFIMDPPKGFVVDHINRDTMDNTISNLRICTNAENQQNRKDAKTNTSGVRGVTWSKANGKWQAQIKFNGKCIYGGYYSELSDAEEAANNLRARYHAFSNI